MPPGIYECKKTPSPRLSLDEHLIKLFGKPFVCPEIFGVPGHEEDRIHPGNSVRDTIGCLCPGQTHLTDFVGNSGAAFRELMGKLPDEFQIEIMEPQTAVIWP
jgi:hypothetical protein